MSPVATPIVWLPRVSAAAQCNVLVKEERHSDATYGGNKARKLQHYLTDAQRRGAGALITLGAEGSHTVLASTLFGQRAGLEVHAVQLPHPPQARAKRVQAAIEAAGPALYPVVGERAAAAKVARLMRRLRRRGAHPYFIPPGATSLLGCFGYDDAVDEIASQIAVGELSSWPDLIVVPVGSGGTYAGLLAGLARHHAPSRLLGIKVYDALLGGRRRLGSLARLVLAYRWRRFDTLPDSIIDPTQLGDGYGWPTEAGRRALDRFALDGVELDLTYTGKAAAGLFAHLHVDPGVRTALFINTYASLGGVH